MTDNWQAFTADLLDPRKPTDRRKTDPQPLILYSDADLTKEVGRAYWDPEGQRWRTDV